MHRVLAIQARMGSTRLPKKILIDLGGTPVINLVIARARRAASIDQIMIATTTNADDDAVSEIAAALGVDCCRGSEEDVLSRYVDAARMSSADVVVRITSDCPFVDPSIIDRTVGQLTSQRTTVDYCANVVQRSFARGLDVEAFYMDTLLRIARMATLPLDREHVTAFARSEANSNLFAISHVLDDQDSSDLRLTVDTPEDLAVARAVFKEFAGQIETVSYKRIVEYLRQHSEISRLNADSKTWSPTGTSFGIVKS